MIYKTNSDITKVVDGIIAHGVNCQGAMGSGVAKALYSKWPTIRYKYLDDFKSDRPILSQVREVKIDDNLSVFNCYTQNYYGYDSTKIYASLYAVLLSMKTIIDRNKYSSKPLFINIPKIGCGLGGLNWKDVECGLLNLEDIHNMNFIVHTL